MSPPAPSGPRPDSALVRAAGQLIDGLARPRVVCAMSPEQPDLLIAALIESSLSRQRPIDLLVADLDGRLPFIGAREIRAIHDGLLTVTTLAGAVPAALSGLVDHVPGSLWDIDRMLASGAIAFDVLVARMHDSGDPGALSYGAMVGYTPSALAAAPRVGFEVAPPVDAPPGPSVPAARADLLTRPDASPVLEPTGPAAPTEEAIEIGRLVAHLIPGDATLQLGLGTLPEAVVPALGDRSDLSFHSGILPTSLVRALRAGRPGPGRLGRAGVHVATGVLGAAPGLGPWPPRTTLQPVAVTHSPTLLAGIDRLWAVNSAFEVDLHGQVNAEYVGGRRAASAGGQVDFFQAAHLSAGGASVLALPSRSRKGRPRITGSLAAPNVVTTPACLVDYVVTEYGCAHLAGRSAQERAAALVAVAHPQDRAELKAAWARHR